MSNSILTLFPTADQLLRASDIELERALLRRVVAISDDPMRRMITRDSAAVELFGSGGYEYDVGKRNDVQKRISRAWRTLEDARLIEEPDPDNGKNGYRVVSPEGREANAATDLAGAKVRSRFARELFHPSLPDAAWNSFRSADYDTAVFEALKAVEVAVRKKGLGKNGIGGNDHGVDLMRKAFDTSSGPLTDYAATIRRRNRRLELFTGTFGELRNPKAHQDPTITDPLIAVEEMMVAGALMRIVDNVKPTP
jgi:Protein of unknown function (Hypoth_ymh)